MVVVRPYPYLHSFVEQIFLKAGCSSDHALTAATVLLSADLRGIDSHGVARLSGYLRLWDAGRMNMQPDIKVVHETPSTAVVDGDAGPGLVVAVAAMQIAIKKANTCGTGWVGVRNSNHFGIAGYHAMLALPHQMIGIAMTNASALVAPTFSVERLLGTNPIAVAIPAGTQPPFVADFATTTAANGKLEILQRDNKPTPEGWLIDQQGQPSYDAFALKTGGMLLPLGSDREHGSHKGYALGSIVDLLSGVLSGANYGPWVPPFPAYVPLPDNMPGVGIGHFFGAMAINAFRPAEEFLSNMDHWIARFRDATPAPGHDKVLIPGDPERECEQHYLETGIPVHHTVYADLTAIAQRFGLVLE